MVLATTIASLQYDIELRLPQATLHKILKAGMFQNYKLQVLHKFSEDDSDIRIII